MEMTGLDDLKDHILEVAVVATDYDLNPIANHQNIVFQPPEVINGMNDWCKKHHGASGLTAAIPSGAPLEQVENELIDFIHLHFGKKANKIVLAGNSIGNDRRFIDRYMPRFAARLHYRMVDVSSFKEVYRERYGIEFKKQDKHRAVDDIYESIAELRHYLSFVQPTIQSPAPPTPTSP